MARTATLSLTLASAIIATPVLAGNPTYRCERGTVDNDALLIAYPKDDIGRFSDPGKKICKFTVNGATRSGPSEPSARPPWKDLIGSLEDGNVRLLVVRLTAAHPGSQEELREFRDALSDFMRPLSEDFAQCFRALRYFGESNQPEPKFEEGRYKYFVNRGSKQFGALCWVTPPGRYRDHSSETSVLFASIRSQSGASDSIFVPKGVFSE